MSVENTKLLSDGEQMSDCHCACIFFSIKRGAWGGAPSMGTLWLSESEASSANLSDFQAADE